MNSYFARRRTSNPIWREARIVWLTFLRDTSKPMSPYLPEIINKLNRLIGERK